MDENKKYTPITDRLDPVSIIRDILKNLWAIALIALAAAMVFNMFARFNHQRSYSTKATLIVKSRTASNMTYSNLSAASNMATSFTNILNSSLLKKKVCQDLELESFNAKASASVIKGTNLMTLQVSSDTPGGTYRIMRSIMNNMNDLTQYVSGDMVMDVLQEPGVPSGADANFTGIREAIQGGLIGLAAGVLLFGILSFFKNTVKTEKDFENKLETRHIGSIYHDFAYRRFSDFFKKQKNRHLVSDLTARFDYVERYKKIAANVSGHAKRNKQQVILVTSVREHEGKSTVAANLAMTLAKQSQSVLLLDGDLRRPTLDSFFLKPGEKLRYGLGGILDDECSVRDAIRYDRERNLYLLLAEKNYQRSTDMVAGRRMRALLDAAKKRFDYIIIDTPPMGLMADAEVMAGTADMSVLVVRYDYTDAEDVISAIGTLENCAADFYGCVFNDVRTLPGTASTTGGYGGYGRYGRYGRYGDYGRYGRYGRYGAYGHYEKASNSEN